jgi:NACHT domain-containing protein
VETAAPGCLTTDRYGIEAAVLRKILLKTTRCAKIAAFPVLSPTLVSKGGLVSLKINAKTVRETLEEQLSCDGEIIKASAEMFAFYVVASSGSPLALAAGIGLILSASASAIKGISHIIKRVHMRGSDPKVALAPYEQFRIIFYAACLQAYLDAIQKPLADLREAAAKEKASAAESNPSELQNALKAAQSKVEEGETPFLLGVDPLKGEIPLYSALSEWMSVLLRNYGYPEYTTQPTLRQATDDARKRFHVFVASDAPEATWVRNYLLVEAQQQAATIANDLASVRSALEAWLSTGETPKAKRTEAWQEYRKQLSLLPDQKDSMYNEEFGVREVFIRPDGTYAIAGAGGDTGKAQRVSDLGSVIGGLLSTRVSGDDLIILCGGPGSGKSTLCRVLASELASDPNVFPVFLRLRRLKEGGDIPAFVESNLTSQNLIDRVADLRRLKNVVVILDGFDELVMASRARLRHFFNSLREDHTNGPLHGMRIIVSGRDTLFPGGEGLPLGSHVLTLLPFDRGKVAAWSTKWRARHQTGPGATFHPEGFLEKEGEEESALHHLVTWPLTLHLVARAHTSGGLSASEESAGKVTKAILYRSILAETAKRQRDQTAGVGRLEPPEMRKLLRAVAWRMYEEGRDSMDLSEILPVLKEFFPGRTEPDLAELADVAVVNSPEITKGEQTGFEFVHKSFAEYLSAEHIAINIERVTYEVPEIGTNQPSWRMSEKEAASEVARFAAIRLLTPEVQEMLEPMLGDFVGFMQGVSARPEPRAEGLNRVIKRFEALLDRFLRGKFARIIDERAGKTPQVASLLEALANFGAGVTLIGAAAARQLETLAGTSAKKFSLDPFDGAFWRLLCLIHAGGVYVNERIAGRLVRGCTVAHKEGKEIADADTPIKTAWFAELDGFVPRIANAVGRDHALRVETVVALQLAMSILTSLLVEPGSKDAKEMIGRDVFFEFERYYGYGISARSEELLAEAQLVPAGRVEDHEGYLQARDLLRHSLRGSQKNDYDILREIDYNFSRVTGRGPGPMRILAEVLSETLRRSGRSKGDWGDRLRSILRLQ